ncbi:hypothetical protein AVEN_190967-1 [Araneus ventricosus]|uniref:Uncharacterized protein n=1 Tax=Araneus ventricosus TaxID=182803 RepID=A0A4Y2EW39_ARAVE|nr:hypothetical protein AVEN_11928-1 [Araneus ventricosus]GBO22919.1 hypothetical protein AVEN_190967-1 [Araneus ventricosus]
MTVSNLLALLSNAVYVMLLILPILRSVPKTISIKRKSKILLNQKQPLPLLQPMLGHTQQHFQPSRRQDKFLQLNPELPVLYLPQLSKIQTQSKPQILLLIIVKSLAKSHN